MTNYIADTPEVADAKDAFRAVYDMYAAGDVAKPVAPVHKVTPVSTYIFSYVLIMYNVNP